VAIVAKTGILIDSNIRYAIFELLELDRMFKILLLVWALLKEQAMAKKRDDLDNVREWTRATQDRLVPDIGRWPERNLLAAEVAAATAAAASAWAMAAEARVLIKAAEARSAEAVLAVASLRSWMTCRDGASTNKGYALIGALQRAEEKAKATKEAEATAEAAAALVRAWVKAEPIRFAAAEEASAVNARLSGYHYNDARAEAARVARVEAEAEARAEAEAAEARAARAAARDAARVRAWAEAEAKTSAAMAETWAETAKKETKAKARTDARNTRYE
jgi:hypothetical protein